MLNHEKKMNIITMCCHIALFHVTKQQTKDSYIEWLLATKKKKRQRKMNKNKNKTLKRKKKRNEEQGRKRKVRKQ